jgi:hypothetical protein
MDTAGGGWTVSNNSAKKWPKNTIPLLKLVYSPCYLGVPEQTRWPNQFSLSESK